MAIIEIRIPAESHEGTTMKVQAWLKQPGDTVSKFEPLVEMETDKVTLEIEAPEDGVLEEILVQQGDDVEPEMIIARLNTTQATTRTTTSPTQEKKVSEDSKTLKEKAPQNSQAVSGALNNGVLSPAVKRFVYEHKLDVSTIQGSGKNNRLTLKDVKQFLAKSNKAKADEGTRTEPVTGGSASTSTLVPHTSMRRSIADHMASSVATAPHVTAIFEADFTAVSAHRKRLKHEYAARGVNLSYTAYIVMACVQAMKAVPQVNSRWHDDATEVFSNINIGIGTALGDKGLIVPVLSDAQDLSLYGVAKELQSMTGKARDNKLKPSDTRGGTFTISNHGVSGSLLATPIIINQPQSAILGVGKLEKRVVVRSIDGQDSMVIKPMAYVSLTIDHRVIDGYQTNAWLSEFVSTLENWSDE